MPVDIHEILNGPRPYDNFEPDDPETLDTLRALASELLFNGQEGSIWILRLIEIIEALQQGEPK